jgi:hypothetical protein
MFPYASNSIPFALSLCRSMSLHQHYNNNLLPCSQMHQQKIKFSLSATSIIAPDIHLSSVLASLFLGQNSSPVMSKLIPSHAWPLQLDLIVAHGYHVPDPQRSRHQLQLHHHLRQPRLT